MIPNTAPLSPHEKESAPHPAVADGSAVEMLQSPKACGVAPLVTSGPPSLVSSSPAALDRSLVPGQLYLEPLTHVMRPEPEKRPTMEQWEGGKPEPLDSTNFLTPSTYLYYVPRLAENRAMVAFAANVIATTGLLAAAPFGSMAALPMAGKAGAVAAWAGGTYALQRHFARGKTRLFMTDKRRYDMGYTLAGRVAVVTGSSGGIGYEVALRMAQLGCDKVIMACRNEDKARKAIANAANHVKRSRGFGLCGAFGWRNAPPCFREWDDKCQERLHFMELDLTSEASIDSFVEKLLDTPGCDKIDYLVNNGGIFSAKGKDMPVTSAGHELQLGTNALGPYLLTELLLPSISRRVVMVSSAAHVMPRADVDADFVEILDNIQFDAARHAMKKAEELAKAEADTKPAGEELSEEEKEEKQRVAARFEAVKARIEARGDDLEEVGEHTTALTYGPSKLLNVMYARHLSRRVRGRGLVVTACHPGGAATEIFREIPIVALVIGAVQKFFFKSAAEAGMTVLNSAIGEDVRNGHYYADCDTAEDTSSPLSQSVVQQEAAMQWCAEQWNYRVPLNSRALAPIETFGVKRSMMESTIEPGQYATSRGGSAFAEGDDDNRGPL